MADNDLIRKLQLAAKAENLPYYGIDQSTFAAAADEIEKLRMLLSDALFLLDGNHLADGELGQAIRSAGIEL